MLLGLAWPVIPAWGQIPELPPDPKVLEKLSEKILPQIVQTLDQLNQWAKTYAELDKAGKDLNQLLANPPTTADEAKIWTKQISAVIEASPTLKVIVGNKLAKQIEDAGGVDAQIEDVKKIAKDVVVTAVRQFAAEWTKTCETHLKKQFPEFLEAIQYAQTIEPKARLVLAQAQGTLDAAKAYKDELFRTLETLRNPSRYVKQFLEGEFRAKFLNKPYTFDAGGNKVVFRVIQVNPALSVFSPQANLGLEIEYSQLSFKLKAYGLFFRPKGNQLPEPVLDKLKVEQNALDVLTSQGLRALGDALPDFGLPIQVKDVQFNDFSKGAKKLSVQFRIVIGLDKLLDFAGDKMPKIEAGVVAHANGNVELGALKAAISTPVPIATTGWAFHGGWLELRPKDNKETFTIGTDIAPLVSKDGVAFKVQVTFGRNPLKTGVSYKGSMTMLGGQLELGEVHGLISREKITFELNSSKLKAMPVALHCKGELNSEGLSAEGHMDALFGLDKTDAELYIGFNGFGSFTASRKISLGGVANASASLQGSFAPGFRKLTLHGAMTVEVDVEPLGSVVAEIQVEATHFPQPTIRVEGSAAGMDFAFNIPSFRELYPELVRQLKGLRDRLYQQLAKVERQVANYAAEREKALTYWVHDNAKRYGLDRLAIDKGGPVDQALGNASRELKNAGKELANWRENTGRALHNLGQQGGKAVDHAGNVLGNIISDPVGSAQGVLSNPSKIFGGGFPGGLGSFPASLRIGKSFGQPGGFGRFDNPVDDALKNVDKQVNELARTMDRNRRLEKLLNALERQGVHKSKHPKQGPVAELRMRFYRAMSHDQKGDETVITLSYQGSGVKYALDPRGKKQGKVSRRSEAQIIEIHLAGLHHQARPKVDIRLPRMANLSDWDETQLVKDHLADVLEKWFPEAAGVKRFEERALMVYNHTDEDINVWVQVQEKKGNQWSWAPKGVGPKLPAYSYQISPKKLVTLKDATGGRLEGKNVRIWAESESGMMWSGHMTKDVPLVDDKDGDGQYRYISDQVQGFVYHFWAGKGPRHLSERIVLVRNATDQPLLVSADVLSQDPGGKPDWDHVKSQKVAPGATVKLRQSNGWYLRGHSAKISAQDEKGNAYRFQQHKIATVSLVDGKSYQGEKIGNYLFVLEKPDVNANDQGKPRTQGVNVVLNLEPDEVNLPSVKDLTLAEAAKKLQALGFKVSAPGAGLQQKVTKQTPGPGWAKPLALVSLTTEPPLPTRMKTPDFFHDELKTAESQAKKMGLEVRVKAGTPIKKLTTKDKELVGKILIVSQTPAKGSEVNQGAVIDVELAQFITAPALILTKLKTPDFYHDDLKSAEAQARKMGLEVRVKSGEPIKKFTTKDKDLVGKTLIVSQTPAKGSEVTKGAIIDVELAQFFAPAPPPPPADAAKTIFHDVKRTIYTISANSLKDVAEIFKKKEAGHTTWQVQPEWKTDGNNKINAVTLTVDFTIRLPRWANVDKQSPAVRSEWQRGLKALDDHELGHVRLTKDRLEGLAKRLLGKTPEQANQVIAQARREIEAANEAYDRDTDHGLKQGTMFNLKLK